MALSESQQALANAMSDISEYCWFARWLIGTEYHLWHFVVAPEDQSRWGNHPVSRESRTQLKRLSAEIGGWIWWPEQAHDVTYIAIGEWQGRFNEWCAERERVAANRMPRRYVDYAEWFARQPNDD